MAAKGRPSKYTQAIADEICERLSNGESLFGICKDEKMPPESTVRGWAVDDHEGFSAKYARARDIGLDHHADVIISLADTDRICQKRTIKADGSEEIVILDQVDRSKLQVDARKWYLSKLAPKKYGDKLAHTGADGEGAIQFVVTRAGKKE